MSFILIEKLNLINMKRTVAKYFFHHQNACIFSDSYLVLLLIITISDIFTFIQCLFSQKVPLPGHQNHFSNHGDAALIFICDL